MENDIFSKITSLNFSDWKLLDIIFKEIPYPILAINKHGEIVIWNTALEILTKDLKNNIITYIDDKSNPLLSKKDFLISRLFRKYNNKPIIFNQFVQEEQNIICKPKNRIFNVKAKLLYSDDQKLIGGIQIYEDISNMVDAEISLAQNDDKYVNLNKNKRILKQEYQKIMNDIPDIIWKTDTTGKTTYISPSITKVLGYTPKEILEVDNFWFKTIHIKDRDKIKKKFEVLFTHNENFDVEYRIKTKNNKWVWLHDRAFATPTKNGKIHAEGIAIDISKKKEIELELQAKDQEYRDLVNNAPSIILKINTEQNILFANNYTSELLGFTNEELIGHSLLDTIFPKSETSGRDLIEMVNDGYSNPNGIICNINENIKKNGESIWIQWSNNQLFDEQGNNDGFLSIGNDITTILKTQNLLKKKEQQLHESQERYRILLEISNFIIWTANLNYDLSYVNSNVKELLGYDMKELTTISIKNFITAKSMNDITNLVNSEIENEKNNPSKKRFFTIECEYIKNDGKIIPVENFMTFLHDINGNISGTMGITRDISERKKKEEEEIRIQKMESLEIFAGGIAHDYNNLLAAILGNIELLSLEPLTTDQKECISDLNQATNQARKLTRQLLTFTKGRIKKKELTSIRKLINQSTSLALRGSKIKLLVDYSKDDFNLNVNVGQINQVMNNILINANQAMPNGGEIKIQISKLDHGNLISSALNDETYALIQIEDQGNGIPKAIQNKIFTPYFTTKIKGNGLGLVNSYKIIQNHGGYINFQSKEGEGTTFFIYLPISN